MIRLQDEGLAVEWAFWATNTMAATAVRRALVCALRSLDCEASHVDAVELVYGELASNAARYAERQEVRVEFAWCDDTCHLIIRSAGAPFAFEPKLAGPEQEHGRGHYIVAALSEAVSVEHAVGVNTVDVRLNVKRRAVG